MKSLSFLLLFCLQAVTQIHAQRPQRSARSTISAPVQNGRASDGSNIIDKSTMIDNLNLRYKISAPASAILGSASYNSAAPKMGLNVLLHGDGGASFEDFPNKNLQGNLMGVVVLAPNDALLWGGQSTSRIQKPDGVAHALAVDKLIREELIKVVDYDLENVWFSGVSGGSLLLSGFFLPMFLSNYKNGAMLMCGGMVPPENRPGLANTLETSLNGSRIHWQSSQQELASLKTTIPASIRYYESKARLGGMSDASISLFQSADATPTAGHCAFDDKGFNSGIQLVSTSWSRVMQQGGDGIIEGIGHVRQGVIGNEALFK